MAKRQANFCEAEKVLLLEFIKENAAIIEGKCAGNTFIKRKRDTWRKCEELFAARGYTRNWETLRDLYFRMKMQAKTSIRDYKLQSTKTGGGPKCKSPTELEWTIQEITPKDFEKDENIFDSDSIMV